MSQTAKIDTFHVTVPGGMVGVRSVEASHYPSEGKTEEHAHQHKGHRAEQAAFYIRLVGEIGKVSHFIRLPRFWLSRFLADRRILLVGAKRPSSQ